MVWQEILVGAIQSLPLRFGEHSFARHQHAEATETPCRVVRAKGGQGILTSQRI